MAGKEYQEGRGGQGRAGAYTRSVVGVCALLPYYFMDEDMLVVGQPHTQGSYNPDTSVGRLAYKVSQLFRPVKLFSQKAKRG